MLDVREPDIDDTVYCCPECERPNQYGDLCETCRQAITREERIEKGMDYDN